MHEPHDQELTLYYYGESRDAEAVCKELASSPALRARYDELCRVLTTVEMQPVPEAPDDYGSRVWHHLAPKLTERPPRRGLLSWLVELFPPAQRLALAGGVAALVVVAFLAGRQLPRTPSPELPPVVAERVGEKIFLVSVGRHLEHSEMLLVELVNAENPSELGPELRQAGELLGFNRLYRQAAKRSGEEGVEDLLEELERLLLELAHSSEDSSSGELAALRQRVDDGGMLFRMRIVSARMKRDHQRQNEPIQKRPPGTTGEV